MPTTNQYLGLFPKHILNWIDQRLYPRRYRTREGYVPAREAARVAGSLMVMDPTDPEVHQMLNTAIDSLAGLIAVTAWSEHQAVQYVLNQSLGEALMRTRVNTDLDYCKMHLPLPGMLIHLPQGLITADEGPIRFMLVGLVTEPKTHYQTMVGKFPVQIAGGGIPRLIVWTLTHAASDAPAYGASIPLRADRLTGYLNGEGEGSMSYSQIDDESGQYQAQFAAPWEIQESDSRTIHQMVGLVLNVMALYQARPTTFVDEAPPIRRERVKRGKVVKPSLWDFREIGRHYKTQPSSSGGRPLTDLERVGRETIWVSGYWRNQPYGPGRSLRQAKWIEPYQRVL